MSMWWVINKETKEMIHSCDDAGKEYCSIGGDQEWLECPEGVSPGNCKVVVISEAIPAVPAVEAVEAVEEVIGVPAVEEVLDEEGNIITPAVAEVIAVAAVEAVAAVAAIPAIPEVRGLVDGSADKASPQWDAMRTERNKRLAACDWVTLSDSPLTQEQKDDWLAYRMLLRDLPQDTESPESVIWPVAP